MPDEEQNGQPEADDEYSRYEPVLISRVTWMEVLVGIRGNGGHFLWNPSEIV